MTDYAYTTVTGKIKPLLEKIRKAGIPPKVTINWLKSLGYTSSNDATLASVLKFIGFTDSSNIPTPKWSAYRGANHRVVLGNAIRQGYAELFSLYPDANTRSHTELNHVFSTSSSGGEQVISKTVQTFKALVEEADFSDLTETSDSVMTSGPLHTPAAANPPRMPTSLQEQGSPEVHIDIQIHISPESSAEQIEKIFESMAKHLYGRKGGE